MPNLNILIVEGNDPKNNEFLKRLQKPLVLKTLKI